MKTRGRKSFEPLVRPRPNNVRRSRKREVTRNRRMSQITKPLNETIVLSDSEVDENVPDEDNEEEIQVIDIADVTQEDDDDVRTPHVANANTSIGNYVTAPTLPSKSPKPVILGNIAGNASPDPDPPVIVLGDDPEPDDDDGVEVVAVVVSSSRQGMIRSTTNANVTRSALNRRKSSSLSQIQDAIRKAKSTIRRNSSSRNSSPSRYVLNSVAANSRQIRRNKKGKKQKRNFQRKQQMHGVNAFHRNRTFEDQRKVVYKVDNDPGSGPWERMGNKIPQAATGNANFSFEAIPFIPFATSSPAKRRPKRVADRAGTWIPKNKRTAPPPIAPGSNIMNVGAAEQRPAGGLRPIVIDGSNVAVGHGKMLHMNKFSAKGIKICVDYFLKRGHKEIIVFVPRHKLKKNESLDPELLEEMEKNGYVRFTPSREAGGQRISSYDDFG
ncbi:unnamed protein product [Orchesella dallaii]|uniref:RNase NYN domain-containing protein n=1 Tax=Orchesella dallaii TaxID=48710 RepID=A0ABP1Q2J2_9HEXA